jgi:hypothetical protein
MSFGRSGAVGRGFGRMGAGASASLNLLAQPKAFDNAVWTKFNASVVADTTLAPDGTTTADTLRENSANNTHQLIQTIAKAGSPLAYLFSVDGKADTRTRIELEVDDGPSGVFAGFDVAGGQIGYGPSTFGSGWTAIGATITATANGFYHCTLSLITNSSTSVNARVVLDSGSGTGAPSDSYLGDGSSGARIWNAILRRA